MIERAGRHIHSRIDLKSLNHAFTRQIEAGAEFGAALQLPRGVDVPEAGLLKPVVIPVRAIVRVRPNLLELRPAFRPPSREHEAFHFPEAAEAAQESDLRVEIATGLCVRKAQRQRLRIVARLNLKGVLALDDAGCGRSCNEA